MKSEVTNDVLNFLVEIGINLPQDYEHVLDTIIYDGSKTLFDDYYKVEMKQFTRDEYKCRYRIDDKPISDGRWKVPESSLIPKEFRGQIVCSKIIEWYDKDYYRVNPYIH